MLVSRCPPHCLLVRGAVFASSCLVRLSSWVAPFAAMLGGKATAANGDGRPVAEAGKPANRLLYALSMRRNQINVCCFLATFVAYVERVGFSIAFTHMARDAQIDESWKGVVFSLFYWGYGVSQVWAGSWLLGQYCRRLLFQAATCQTNSGWMYEAPPNPKGSATPARQSPVTLGTQ